MVEFIERTGWESKLGGEDTAEPVSKPHQLPGFQRHRVVGRPLRRNHGYAMVGGDHSFQAGCREFESRLPLSPAK
jgi:hypothetical protein